MAKLGRREAALGLGLAAIAGGWQIWGVREETLQFAPITRAPGWSFAMGGDMSGLSSVDFMTVGIEKGPVPLPAVQLSDVLFRDTTSGVRVAVFSDFFCPYCRSLVGRLRARVAAPDIAVNWHELPLLGPHSVLAAKAAEAAALQGGYAAFYNGLLAEGFRPTRGWMRRVAETVGLDGARLEDDMRGPIVAGRLEASAAAAATLGVFATPGIVIGRKVVLGALDTNTMEELFRQEMLAV